MQNQRESLAASQQVDWHMGQVMEAYFENGRSTPGPKQTNEGETSIDPGRFAKMKAELKL